MNTFPTDSPPSLADRLWVPSHPARHINRRRALERLGAGFGMIGLASLLGNTAALSVEAARKGQIKARAKRVIFLFMNGGPSHMDTFDPKPALKKFEGQQPAGELYKKTRARDS